MNNVDEMLKVYNEKSPRAATFVVLYANLILNIIYGVIYVLLHETLFPETWTNITITLAFTETVILFYAVITLHNRKFFMLRWTVFIILDSSGFLIIRIIRLMREPDNWGKDWDHYFSKIVIDMNTQLGQIFSNESVNFLSKFASPVIQIFLFITLVFKYYSAWTIHQSEQKRKSKALKNDIFF